MVCMVPSVEVCMTDGDEIVVARVARRLINAGDVMALRHLHGMSLVELELLAGLERAETAGAVQW